MDITQLRTLLHVAELGSLSKAAERLNTAQPALSRQMRLLEEELGAAVFVRHGRGMELTEIGAELLGPSRTILAELAKIRRIAEQDGGALTGRVRLGITPTVAEVVTVPLARRIRQQHPRLSLCFTTGFSGHLIDWLKRGQLDCCVSYDPEVSGAVYTEPVLEESLMLVGSSARGLKMSQPVEFESLEREDLVLPSPLHGLRKIVDSFALRSGAAFSPVMEADSFGALIDLVREGFGLTILPLAPIYERVTAGDISAAPLKNPAPTRRVVMVYPADRPVSPAVRFVGESFVSLAADLAARGVWSGRILKD